MPAPHARLLPPEIHHAPVQPPEVHDLRGDHVPVHPSGPVHPVVPVHPIVPVHPVVPPQHAPPSREEPPEAHHRHGDYVFVEGYGWWPSWFPYWEPYWYAYWQYLYDYYGGDANADYAEYARDAVLREMAPQWGWQ